jgi:hypothetical protein
LKGVSGHKGGIIALLTFKFTTGSCPEGYRTLFTIGKEIDIKQEQDLAKIRFGYSN